MYLYKCVWTLIIPKKNITYLRLFGNRFVCTIWIWAVEVKSLWKEMYSYAIRKKRRFYSYGAAQKPFACRVLKKNFFWLFANFLIFSQLFGIRSSLLIIMFRILICDSVNGMLRQYFKEYFIQGNRSYIVICVKVFKLRLLIITHLWIIIDNAIYILLMK
jgi:hypothetical protein